MANLQELYTALEAIKQNRKSAKLFFYFLDKDDSQMHSGFFSINTGESCCISYFGKPNDIALSEIPYLQFTKIMTLPNTVIDQSKEPFGPCEVDEVLDRLNPVHFAVATPEPVLASPETQPAPASKAHVFYSHVAMQQDATQILETLYGSGAAKKVEEIAFDLPPHQYPSDFLDKCKQHASMMLGPKKADEIFKPLYDKLA